MKEECGAVFADSGEEEKENNNNKTKSVNSTDNSNYRKKTNRKRIKRNLLMRRGSRIDEGCVLL